MKHSLTRLAAAALALTCTLGLAGCANGTTSTDAESSSSQSDSTPVVDRSGSLNFPAVTGAFGEEPTISAGTGDAPAVIAVKTLSEGSGDEVGADDAVLVNYSGVLWDGTSFDSSFGEGGKPVAFSLNGVIPGWKYGLAEQHVGDRVEIVVPSEYGYGSQSTGTIPADSVLVFVVDILDSFDPTDTSGLAGATATGNTLPAGVTIGGELGAEPTLSLDSSASVSEDTTVVVAEGTGDEVTATDTVMYQAVVGYPGDASGVQSTWSQGGAQVAEAGAPQFVGHKVGDRLLIAFAPTADASQSGASSVDQQTTFFVVDIVGILRAPQE